MALRYKTRKWLAFLVLVLGLPVYIVAVIWIIAQFDRPPFWLELAIYVGCGVVWALPLRALFRGIGQPDPDQDG